MIAGDDYDVPGMNVYYAIAKDRAGIAFGSRQPGSPLAMVAGFDPGALASPPKWIRRVNAEPGAIEPSSVTAVADIANGLLYLVYSPAHDRAVLQASALATGAIVWEREIPRSRIGGEPSSITITTKHVYVPHWSYLDVFDASSGTHLLTIGE